jgi:hypothetical protein
MSETTVEPIHPPLPDDMVLPLPPPPEVLSQNPEPGPFGATTPGGLPYPVGTDKVVDGDDAIKALALAVDPAFVGWTAYTPQWLAGGNPVVLGAGGIVQGYFRRTGLTCDVWVKAYAGGAGFSSPTGQWILSIPFLGAEYFPAHGFIICPGLANPVTPMPVTGRIPPSQRHIGELTAGEGHGLIGGFPITSGSMILMQATYLHQGS